MNDGTSMGVIERYFFAPDNLSPLSQFIFYLYEWVVWVVYSMAYGMTSTGFVLTFSIYYFSLDWGVKRNYFRWGRWIEKVSHSWHLTIDCLTNSAIIAKDLCRDGVANESEFNGFLFNSMIKCRWPELSIAMVIGFRFVKGTEKVRCHTVQLMEGHCLWDGLYH